MALDSVEESTADVRKPARVTGGKHLRVREPDTEQRVTFVELFFDLVYVFAITQISHLLIDDLSARGIAKAVFLLMVVWWAWIYTTWMANWFDPASVHVRLVLIVCMLCSLLLAAALPHAFEQDGGLFAVAYVALQVGRNAAGTVLLGPRQQLRANFECMLVAPRGAGRRPARADGRGDPGAAGRRTCRLRAVGPLARDHHHALIQRKSCVLRGAGRGRVWCPLAPS